MIQEFATYLSSLKGYSDNTVKAYKKDCEDFIHYVQQHTNKRRWSEITRKEVDAYIISLSQAGQKPATTNRKLSSISAIYKYMMREGLEVNNPCKYESRRKVTETIPATISPQDIKDAYDDAKGTAKIMLGLLATTGIRIGELLKIKWDEIDLKTGVINIHGKGHHDRQVITTQDVCKQLRERSQGFDLKCPIFIMSQRSARRLIWETLNPYSRARQLSPHAIRHTFATELAKQGANTSAIAKVLGHKHLSTTQKYIDMAQLPAMNGGISLT